MTNDTADPRASLLTAGSGLMTTYASPSNAVVPRFLSTLRLNGDAFAISFTEPQPNRWRRFWYHLLLGWEWENVP